MIPVVPRFRPTPDEPACRRAEALAERLLREQPALRLNEALRPLVPERIDDAPSLHVDDLTSIALIDRLSDVSYVEDRARLRAAAGDAVASCAPDAPAFERYFAEVLGLGPVEWLHPARRDDPKAVASACWLDPAVRAALVDGIRSGRYRYLHPHIGNHAAWALAVLLSKASGRRLKVIAPHPGLTRAVNDKNWFAEVVKRLLGREYVPRTYRTYNLSSVAQVLAFLARRAGKLVIKVPDSCGGAGTLVIEAGDLRTRSTGEIKSRLRERLAPLRWRPGDPLLVGDWESGAVQPISCQLWVAPERRGAPVVEGVFQQLVEDEVFFVGSHAADLPAEILRAFVDGSSMLARLFQALGYVGRCSFDAIVLGEGERRRLEFIECNGRWGGASAPMTLMNRLFGPSGRQAYVTRRSHAPGLEKIPFAALLDHFGSDLYDVRKKRGRLILYSPGGLQSASGVDVIALGSDVRDAVERTLRTFVQELDELAARAA